MIFATVAGGRPMTAPETAPKTTTKPKAEPTLWASVHQINTKIEETSITMKWTVRAP